MIKSVVTRTRILTFILLFMAVGYTIAHNKVVVVPLLEADAGVSGYERVVVIESDAFSGTLEETVVVNCPAGKKVLGGGGFESQNAVMTDSYPQTESTWIVSWELRAGAPNTTVSLNGYAICANTIN